MSDLSSGALVLRSTTAACTYWLINLTLQKVVISAMPPSLAVPRGRSPLVAREGETVDLECVVTGKPKPILLWTRADREAPMPDGSAQMESYDGVLRVANVSREMSGQYRCQTSQYNGFNVKPREAVVELIVQYPPTVEPTYMEIRQGLGRAVSMSCRVLRAHPSRVLRYEWRLGSKPLQSGHFDTRDETEYSIRALAQENYGEYVCEIVNEAGAGRCVFNVTAKAYAPEFYYDTYSPIWQNRPRVYGFKLQWTQMNPDAVDRIVAYRLGIRQVSSSSPSSWALYVRDVLALRQEQEVGYTVLTVMACTLYNHLALRRPQSLVRSEGELGLIAACPLQQDAGQQRWWEQEIPVETAIRKGELLTYNLTELIRPEAYEVRLTPITHFGEGDSTVRIVTYSVTEFRNTGLCAAFIPRRRGSIIKEPMHYSASADWVSLLRGVNPRAKCLLRHTGPEGLKLLPPRCAKELPLIHIYPLHQEAGHSFKSGLVGGKGGSFLSVTLLDRLKAVSGVLALPAHVPLSPFKAAPVKSFHARHESDCRAVSRGRSRSGFYGRRIKNKGKTSEFHCSFEEEPICLFTQDKNDDFDWTRHSAATRDTKYTPNTGPSGDRTGSKQGFYMYIETSRPRKLGDRARLVSPIFNVAPKSPYGLSNPPAYCFSFYYHMYGKHIGTLNAFLKQKGQSASADSPVWTLTGNQGDRWRQAKVSIHPTASFQVAFEGVRGPGIEGDIAIDDVILEEGECPNTPPTPEESKAPSSNVHIWLLVITMAMTLLRGQR
ncbi:hypothetical protein ACEWY4_022261 [Coilia grayii]|uniref:MAM domain-containing glycosylphosphatidylinositol anchor protein 2 n=1 Tax=Coilia grayii TaxID=363190 RepID=A0ABD1J8Z0_9TELE